MWVNISTEEWIELCVTIEEKIRRIRNTLYSLNSEDPEKYTLEKHLKILMSLYEKLKKNTAMFPQRYCKVTDLKCPLRQIFGSYDSHALSFECRVTVARTIYRY